VHSAQEQARVSPRPQVMRTACSPLPLPRCGEGPTPNGRLDAQEEDGGGVGVGVMLAARPSAVQVPPEVGGGRGRRLGASRLGANMVSSQAGVESRFLSQGVARPSLHVFVSSRADDPVDAVCGSVTCSVTPCRSSLDPAGHSEAQFGLGVKHNFLKVGTLPYSICCGAAGPIAGSRQTRRQVPCGIERVGEACANGDSGLRELPNRRANREPARPPAQRRRKDRG
jgi:hypothetical protein